MSLLQDLSDKQKYTWDDLDIQQMTKMPFVC